MKTKIIIIAFLLIATMFYSFKIAYDIKSNSAEVDQEGGINIFYRARPLMEYEHLGTVKLGLNMSGKIDAYVDKLIKKAKEEYPSADAIIIDGSMLKADAIKTKK